MKQIDWHFVTSLRLAIARAILRGDVRGETVLLEVLAMEVGRG